MLTVSTIGAGFPMRKIEIFRLGSFAEEGADIARQITPDAEEPAIAPYRPGLRLLEAFWGISVFST